VSYNIIFHGQHHYQRPNLIVGGMPAVANDSRDWKDMMKVDDVYLFSTEWKPHEGKFPTSFPELLGWSYVPFEDREDIEIGLPFYTIVTILETTKATIELGGTVAYTCFGGYNRSGMFAALYSKALGLEDPVGLVQRARAGCLKNPKFVDFVNRFEYKFKA